MTKLKAILTILFGAARRTSARGETSDLRLGRSEIYDLQALLLEDHTPEHERGEW